MVVKEPVAVQAASLGVDTWECVPGFAWTPLPVPFSFADFSLSPFPVINCIHDSNSFSECVSPSSEPLNMTVVLGTQTQPSLHLPTCHMPVEGALSGQKMCGLDQVY